MAKITKRFGYIDQFRGFIGILMLLGHSSYYFNSLWLSFNPLDPLFPSQAQFLLRYFGYLCAPGFLIMAGAMVWLSYQKSIAKGQNSVHTKWYFIQRGLFLVLVQMIWVNSAWSGFERFNPWHLGIIACIGISMVFLTTIISKPWYVRLLVASAILIIHPFLIDIPFDPNNTFQTTIMEIFVIAGSFNKYPVMPWFALALLGSVMANFWFEIWDTHKKQIWYGLTIAILSLGAAILIRLNGGFGNISDYSTFGTFSFFADQKYPPSLFHNLWFFGLVVFFVTLFKLISFHIPRLTHFFEIVGKVPLFYYCIHIALLGVFVKRLDFMYLKGGILETLVGFAILLAIMMFLAKWFYKVKSRNKSYFIRMI